MSNNPSDKPTGPPRRRRRGVDATNDSVAEEMPSTSFMYGDNQVTHEPNLAHEEAMAMASTPLSASTMMSPLGYIVDPTFLGTSVCTVAGGTSSAPPAELRRTPGSAVNAVTTSSSNPSTGTVETSEPMTPTELEVIDGYGHVRLRQTQEQVQPQPSPDTSVNAAEAAIMHAAANIPVNVSNMNNVFRMPGTDITADARRHDPAPFQTVNPQWLNEAWLPSWDTNNSTADPPADSEFNSGELGVADPLEVGQQGWEMQSPFLYTRGYELGAGSGAGAPPLPPPRPSHADFGGRQEDDQGIAGPSQAGDSITISPVEGYGGQAERTPSYTQQFGADATMQPVVRPLGGGSGQPAPSTNLIPRDGGAATRAGLTNPFGWSTYNPVDDEPIEGTPYAEEPPQQEPEGEDSSGGHWTYPGAPAQGRTIHPQAPTNPPIFADPVRGVHGPSRNVNPLPPGPMLPTGRGTPLPVSMGPALHPPPPQRPEIQISRFSTEDEIRERIRQLPDLINEQQDFQIQVLNGVIAALPAWQHQPQEARARHVQDLRMNQTRYFELVFTRERNVDLIAADAMYVRLGRPSHPLTRQRILLEVAMRAANGLPQEDLGPDGNLRLRRIVLEAQLLTIRAWTHVWRQQLPVGHPEHIDPNIPFNDGTAQTQAQNQAAYNQVVIAAAAANGVSVEDMERAMAFGNFMESG